MIQWISEPLTSACWLVWAGGWSRRFSAEASGGAGGVARVQPQDSIQGLSGLPGWIFRALCGPVLQLQVGTYARLACAALGLAWSCTHCLFEKQVNHSSPESGSWENCFGISEHSWP